MEGIDWGWCIMHQSEAEKRAQMEPWQVQQWDMSACSIPHFLKPWGRWFPSCAYCKKQLIKTWTLLTPRPRFIVHSMRTMQRHYNIAKVPRVKQGHVTWISSITISKDFKKEKLSSIMKEQKIRRLIPLPSQKKDCSMSSKIRMMRW